MSPTVLAQRPQRSFPFFAILLLAGMVFLLSGRAAADPGDLDPTFSGDGKHVLTFPLAHQHTAREVLVQPDGRIVVGGDAVWNDTGFDFTLARYNSDGSLDSSFGEGGVARSRLPGNDRAMGIALQPDGRLVAAGYTFPEQNMTLMRFRTDGTLDTGFGSGGVVVTSFPGFNSFAVAVAIRPGGKIVAGGSTGGFNPNFALAQYNPDGSPDTGFGAGGRVNVDFRGEFEQATDMVLQPDGKVVLAGFISYPTAGSDLLLARYQTDGSLDTTFGTGGIAITAVRRVDQLQAVALQPDGKIVAAGVTIGDGSPWSYVLVRYGRNGALDSGFGTGGIVTDTSGFFSFGYAVAVQQNGKIVVGGLATGIGRDFALARHLDDGSLDPDFGDGGYVFTDFGYGGGGTLFGLALQPDGKIVATGRVNDSVSTHTFATARYLGDEIEDEPGLCLQDEKGFLSLSLDPVTGAYRFLDASTGQVLEAQGTVTSDGCKIHLKDHGTSAKKPERILNAVIDTCAAKGHATLRISSSKKNFKIQDRDTADSSCN